MITFHACCHGGRRRKHTGWLSTPGVFDQLAAQCQNDHDHLPFGVSSKQGKWHFDTSDERVYPRLLAQRAAACLVRAASKAGFSLHATTRLHDESTAALGKQSRRHKPLIPEYHHFKNLARSEPLPPNSKSLPPNLGGSEAEDAAQGDADQLVNIVKVGFYHTPKQFLSLAMQARHPMDTANHLEEPAQSAISFNLQYPPEVILLERKKNLLQAKLMAKKLEAEEALLHAKLEPHLQKVLEGKRLLLWRELLMKYGFDDLGVFDFMAKGVPLVGQHDIAPCYPTQYKFATMRRGDLDKSAVWRRKAILGKWRGEANPDHVEHLEATCAEEVEMGFLEGPFYTEEAVSEALGRSDWSLIRRFVLVQGAELKLRPMDDCLESQLNSAFTSNSYLKLQDIDYVAGMALQIAAASSSGNQRHGSGAWLGKCLDLSNAYKQIGILPAHVTMV